MWSGGTTSANDYWLNTYQFYVVWRQHIGERPPGEPELAVRVEGDVDAHTVHPVQQEVGYVLDFRFAHGGRASVHDVTFIGGRILYNVNRIIF